MTEQGGSRPRRRDKDREAATSTGRRRTDRGDRGTPFDHLAEYAGLPRVSGLTASPDGGRLVTTVAEPSADGKRYSSSLWEVDPAGGHPARRLTRSAPGESQPVFLPDGRLLFASRRPDAEAKDDDSEDRVALWLLPEAGEARQMARRGGDVGEVAVARGSGDVVFTALALPGTSTVDEDEARRKARKEAGVTAILHERHPVRHWDHDLGPDESHVLVAGPVAAGEGKLAPVRDLTPQPEGRVEEGLAISPDGRTIAVGWRVDDAPAANRPSLALLDTVSGERRLVEQDDELFGEPAFSPDGLTLACVQEGLGDWEVAPHCTLRLVDARTGEVGRDLLPDTTLRPSGPVFAPDGRSLYFVADDRGHAPAFRLDLTGGEVVRLTSAGAYTNLVVAPDGSALYALRSAVDSPPTPVRLDPARPEQEPRVLLGPAEDPPLPGFLTEVTTTADDGVALRAWLALPDGASPERPAPLLLWIHGGPLEQLERLVLAVEPVADGGARLRGAAS